MTTPKYRPYFTYQELQEIIHALKASPTPSRLSLIRYLDGFILQIERGLRSPNSTIAPSLSQKLELEPSTPIPTALAITGEAAYQKWLLNPAKASPHEIQAANDFRYLNNLMSADEEAQYEYANGL